MGRIDIRQIEQYDDESVWFQKIKMKKPASEQQDNQQPKVKPDKRKK